MNIHENGAVGPPSTRRLFCHKNNKEEGKETEAGRACSPFMTVADRLSSATLAAFNGGASK